jgi:tRNA-dihydrouridine synthase
MPIRAVCARIAALTRARPAFLARPRGMDTPLAAVARGLGSLALSEEEVVVPVSPSASSEALENAEGAGAAALVAPPPPRAPLTGVVLSTAPMMEWSDRHWR